jgi:hypothetical protein
MAGMSAVHHPRLSAIAAVETRASMAATKTGRFILLISTAAIVKS